MPNVISLQQLKQLTDAHVRIIDIRQSAVYKRNIWFETENIPYEKLLLHPDYYICPHETIYLICEFGSDSLRAARILEMQGYDVISVRQGYSGLTSCCQCRRGWK
ncbi:MAG: rhodanese-like domain-containing protein [Turicibacter sp.]|nr:rhodanese-like domain-containing protein [Turicibacter sp.]